MLDLSPDKLLMLAAVALVVLGPNRLPGAARTLGRFIGQMRAMSSSLQTEVRDALHDPEDAFRSVLADLHPSEVRRTVRRAMSDTLAPSGPGTSADPAESRRPSPSPGPQPGAAPDGAAPADRWGIPPSPDDPGFN